MDRERYELWPGGPQIKNRPGVYAVGTDAMLLADFAGHSRGMAADLGCGAGVIALALAWRDPELKVLAVDILEAAARAAEENAALNGLSDRVEVRCCDLRKLTGAQAAERFDLVVSNPPYYPVESGFRSPDPSRAAARTELCCTLEELCLAAARLLKTGGRFCVVHKPERLAELFYALQRAGLEPKRLRMVQSRPDSPPSLVLVESKKGARHGLRIEAPVLLA